MRIAGRSVYRRQECLRPCVSASLCVCDPEVRDGGRV